MPDFDDVVDDRVDDLIRASNFTEAWTFVACLGEDILPERRLKLGALIRQAENASAEDPWVRAERLEVCAERALETR